jgi:hypothetical protein
MCVHKHYPIISLCFIGKLEEEKPAIVDMNISIFNDSNGGGSRQSWGRSSAWTSTNTMAADPMAVTTGGGANNRSSYSEAKNINNPINSPITSTMKHTANTMNNNTNNTVTSSADSHNNNKHNSAIFENIHPVSASYMFEEKPTEKNKATGNMNLY